MDTAAPETLGDKPKFAIIQLGRIGDMILLTPVFRELKKNLPGSHLTVIAGRHNIPVALSNKNVDRALVLEKSFFKPACFIRSLRKEKFDVYFDPKDHASTESKIIASLARSSVKIGYEKNKIFDISNRTGNDEPRHYADRALDVLRIFGMNITDNKPEIFVKQDSEKYVGDYYNNILKKKIVINISASSEKKMWQNENWKKLIDAVDKDKYDVTVTFAPAENIKAGNLHKISSGMRLFRSRSLDDVVSLIKASDAVITPDTAVVHISAAFDKPLLALYSWVPGFIEKFHPLNSNYIMIKTEKGTDGIKAITSEEVIAGWKKLEFFL